MKYLVVPLFFIATSLSAQLGEIPDAATWEQKVDERYASVHPFTDDNNDNDAFAWQVHYWLRAYGNMANLTGNTKWVDWGFEIIDHMFDMTDRERWRRGELDISDFNYENAPLDLWQLHWCVSNSSDTNCSELPYNIDSNRVSLSWRRPFQGQWRIETLNDGMVTHGIMRFIDAILSNEAFNSYETKAREVIEQVSTIVAFHENNYSFTKNAPNVGGFYYTRADNPFNGNGSDSRLYNDGVPLNHSTTMAATMLLLDKWDGPRPEYGRMAEYTLGYFLRSVSIKNNAYVWDYSPRAPRQVEDVVHGHVDLSLVTLLWREGSKQLNDSIMQTFANVVSNGFWAGNGDIYNYVDGSNGLATGSAPLSIAYDYIDFTPWDETILDKAEAVLVKHAKSPWSRPMLGWSNVLRWKKAIADNPDIIKREPDVIMSMEQRRLDYSKNRPHKKWNANTGVLEIHLPDGKIFNLQGQLINQE